MAFFLLFIFLLNLLQSENLLYASARLAFRLLNFNHWGFGFRT